MAIIYDCPKCNDISEVVSVYKYFIGSIRIKKITIRCMNGHLASSYVTAFKSLDDDYESSF